MHRNVRHSENKGVGGGDDHLRTTRGEAKEDTRGQNEEQQSGREKIRVHLSVHQKVYAGGLVPKKSLNTCFNLSSSVSMKTKTA